MSFSKVLSSPSSLVRLLLRFIWGHMLLFLCCWHTEIPQNYKISIFFPTTLLNFPINHKNSSANAFGFLNIWGDFLWEWRVYFPSVFAFWCWQDWQWKRPHAPLRSVPSSLPRATLVCFLSPQTLLEHHVSAVIRRAVFCVRWLLLSKRHPGLLAGGLLYCFGVCTVSFSMRLAWNGLGCAALKSLSLASYVFLCSGLFWLWSGSPHLPPWCPALVPHSRLVHMFPEPLPNIFSRSVFCSQILSSAPYNNLLRLLFYYGIFIQKLRSQASRENSVRSPCNQCQHLSRHTPHPPPRPPGLGYFEAHLRHGTTSVNTFIYFIWLLILGIAFVVFV